MDIPMGKRQVGPNEVMSSKPNPKESAPRQLIFPNRENVVAQQLQNALGAVALASNALNVASLPRGNDSSVPESAVSSFPAEGKIALENLLNAACDRAEKILADDQRWDLALQMQLEQEFESLREENMATLKMAQSADLERYKLAQELGTPHAKYRPKLGKTTDGRYVALIGNPADPEACIMGIGDSPALALQAFDIVFTTGITQKQQSLITQNESSELDAGRTEETGGTKSAQEVEPGNIPGAGPVGGLGGRSAPEGEAEPGNGGIRGWFKKHFGRRD